MDELGGSVITSSDAPTAWAIVSTTSNSIAIRLDAKPETAYTLYADGVAEVADLSGSNEPAFPESFHDILIEGVLREEYLKIEKPGLADRAEAAYEKRLSGLRMFMAKTGYLEIYQGKTEESVRRGVGGGSAAQAVTGPTSSTDNAVVRWNGTGGTIVQDSGITIDDSDNISIPANASVTMATGTGVLTVPNTGLHLFDTDASHDLIVKPGSNLTADRTLTVTTGDAARTLTISGDATVSQDYSTAGNPQFSTVEVGHASDSTLSRVSAGILGVEGIALVTISASQTLTNKTINLASNTLTGTTAEFNTALSDGNFATLAGTETLTNKTITDPTLDGTAVTIGGGASATEVRLLEPSGSGSSYTGFKAPALAGNVIYTLPTADGSSGQVLSTNASGTLSWSSASTVQQSFRGLHLRTSPNADVAATTVTLLHADEIALDGAAGSVSDWDNLSAVITSSGAGGLDTGTEAASTWYEIYAIRKSSDGTKSLLLHRAKDYFLDEQQTTDNQSRELREGATTNVKIAQTFDTDEAGKLEFVDVKLLKQGSPTGRIWVEVFSTSAGAPTGSALATSDKLDVSRISTTALIIRFVFRSPQTLVAGTTYAIALAGDYTASATVNIIVRENSAGGYAAGSVYTYDGTNWASDTEDLWFKVYVTRNDSAVTMPTGYDQKCKVGYVYNDSGSNLDPFVARDRFVRSLISQGVGSTTAVIPTLVDISNIVPPVPLMVLVAAGHDTDNAAVRISGVPDGIEANDGVGGMAYLHANGNLYTPTSATAEVMTEMQGLYQWVGVGTGQAFVLGWRW